MNHERPSPKRKKADIIPALLLSILLLSTTALNAQGTDPAAFRPTLNLSAYAQTWFTLSDSPSQTATGPVSLYGFSLRRLRISPYGAFSKRLNWRITLSWDRLQADVLDAFLDYTISPTLSLRAGLFPVPGAISGALTPSSDLDCIERPAITQFWSQNTALHQFRNIGVMLSGSIMQERAHYFLMVANSSAQNPFDIHFNQPIPVHTQNGLKFWGRIETQPIDNLDIGAFFSNTVVDSLETKNNSYGANLFFNLDALYIKMEYIAGEYGIVDQLNEWRGFWLSVSYGVGHFSPILRYDSYTPSVLGVDTIGVNRYDNITLGLTYSPRTALRLQANIVFRREEDQNGRPLGLQNNLFGLNLQYLFKGRIL